MYLEDSLKKPLSFEEKLVKFKAETSIASFLSNVCDRLNSNGGSIVPPAQPIGNGQPSPENTAREKLEQHWRNVIHNASDVLAENENLKDKYQKATIDSQMEKAKSDQEFIKDNAENITAVDQQVPDGAIVHIDPYIFQIKGSKMDYSRVLSSVMSEYLLPKFTLISSGKVKESGLEDWEAAFWKAASNSGQKPETSDTDFPVDADLWNQCREIFGLEGATEIRRTVEPLENLNEKVHKYANATISKLTMTLVEVTAPEPKAKPGALESIGNSLKRYIEFSVEIEQIYQNLLKFCTDKYNVSSTVVRGVATYYSQMQQNATEKTKEEVASEMAALQF